jgi:hypothetical protein
MPQDCLREGGTSAIRAQLRVDHFRRIAKKTAANMLRAPLKLIIHGSQAVFARPIFNVNVSPVVGSDQTRTCTAAQVPVRDEKQAAAPK